MRAFDFDRMGGETSEKFGILKKDWNLIDISSDSGQYGGEKAFDGHALGCSICVDITQDVMWLMDTGRPINEIQEFIDKKYSAFGPSNIP